MKFNRIIALLGLSAAIVGCENKLPYDLEGVTHSVAVSVGKKVGSDLVLGAGVTSGNYVLSLTVPEYMGDYESYFKEAQILCIFTQKSTGKTTAKVVKEGITTLPADVTIDMADVCSKFGISAPALGDKMQFTANVVHKDGTVIDGWNEYKGFNNMNITFLENYEPCATYAAYAPLDLSKYNGGNTVKFTESVGSSGEASYGVDVTKLASSDIPAEVIKDGFTADDYIGLSLYFNWYGWYDNDYNDAYVTYNIYINKKDFSVSAPTQVVLDPATIGAYNDAYGYGSDGVGQFIFKGFNGELDTETNILSFTMTANWVISLGTLNFGADDYEIDFSTVL